MKFPSLRILTFMSGSSLDGMDLGIIEISFNEGKYTFEIQCAETIPYNEFWAKALKEMPKVSAENLVKFDFQYAEYCAHAMLDFCKKHNSKPDVISYHGHTIFHNPQQGYTYALGNLAALQSIAKLPVLGDFRDGDVAIGGQGAPLMGIADTLLFDQHRFNINLGGIANVSDQSTDKSAFDICPCNQLYNYIYSDLGIIYDDNGNLASNAVLNEELLADLLSDPYLSKEPPKSLDNNYIVANFLPKLNIDIPSDVKLRTITEFVSISIVDQLEKLSLSPKKETCLVSGGGAHNDFLIETLKSKLTELNINLIVPSKEIIDFKELILMALLAYLKMNNKPNVLASFTGAKSDTISGGIYG